MTIVAVLRPTRPTRPSTDRGRRRAGLTALGALAALTAVRRRLAASPLDSTVLHAVGAPSTAPTSGRTGGLRARWQTTTAPDGTTRLEATWHPAR
ncbi:hypothetical protein ACIRST_12325 [Kitasatospora sp. NPDC101447]|uniref:hypothetical protein n=1 Tax=Kitasatospora sp. NPDC101447 TaxID=3364102 RepID=UPI0037FF19F2